jgi:2-polyprenyl-3-methyl-5-hydroxy-6-metoxy-1,4-benzoquinol methylase
VTNPVGPPEDPLAADLALAESNADPAALHPGTRAPFFKRRLLRLLRIYTSGQVLFNYAATRVLQTLAARLGRLQQQSEALAAQAADAARRLLVLESESRAVSQRVHRISPPTLDQVFLPGAYVEFENQFRGSREEILRRQASYVPFLRTAAQRIGRGARLLDLGCGRGELLELASTAGLEATGVDSDAAMVEACRVRGLKARTGDLFEALWAEKEESLAGVVALQVIEHLSLPDVRTLVDLAYQRLRSGGCLILETINPASAYAMRTFHLDPTHRQPVPDALCHFLCAQAGFRDVRTHFLNPVDDPKLLEAIEGNEGLKTFADLLLGFRDYAVVGWRE